MKNVACEGCQLDSPFAQIMTSPKTSVKANGMATYAGSLTIQVSGYSGQGITSGVGSDTLQPSAQHVKIEGEKAVLEGDNVTIQVTGNTSGGGTATVPVTVTITDAGQSVFKGV